MPVENARAAARQAREKSDKERESESEKELKRLLQRSPSEQLDALDSNEILIPEQRRKLVEHLEGLISGPKALETVSAAMATWWEVWLSRLPYRIVSWTAKGLVISAFAAAALVAYARTPKDMVVSVYDEDMKLKWTFNGEEFADVLHARQAYGRMAISGDWSQLRVWEPSLGYRTIWSPNSYVKPLNKSPNREQSF